MKRFKELRNEIVDIQEDHVEGGQFGYDPTPKTTGRSAQPEIKPISYEDEYDLHKMNAFITAFCSKSYIDPRSALYLLRAKMNLAGIDFDLNRGTELSIDQEYTFPLKRFGGTFGTSPSHNLANGFETTNGFGGKNFVLKCKIAAPQGGGKSGVFMINAQIEEA